MIEIDGSSGEGGGQILRTSIAMSMITSQAVRIDNIRAGRSKPGLLRQHLTAVKAASEVSGAKVDGAHLGSKSLTFRPGKTQPGEYLFSIGSAGSCTLVLQTVLPALMITDGPSTITLQGGTHNPFAPPFPFLERAFAPLINRCGPNIDLELKKAGFYPAGGGEFTATISPADKIHPFNLLERGKLIEQKAIAIVSNLPGGIAQRQLSVVRRKLGWSQKCLDLIEYKNSPGPGNAIVLIIRYENVTEVFTGFGEKNLSAERVAQRAISKMKSYLKHDAPVGDYLADQLLIPSAMAGSGSFRTTSLSEHTRTNVQTIKAFMDVKIEHRTESDETNVLAIG